MCLGSVFCRTLFILPQADANWNTAPVIPFKIMCNRLHARAVKTKPVECDARGKHKLTWFGIALLRGRDYCTDLNSRKAECVQGFYRPPSFFPSATHPNAI